MGVANAGRGGAVQLCACLAGGVGAGREVVRANAIVCCGRPATSCSNCKPAAPFLQQNDNFWDRKKGQAIGGDNGQTIGSVIGGKVGSLGGAALGGMVGGALGGLPGAVVGAALLWTGEALGAQHPK